jgi:hypothetical protein
MTKIRLRLDMGNLPAKTLLELADDEFVLGAELEPG